MLSHLLYPNAQHVVISWIKTLLVCLTVFAVIWVLTILLPYFLTIPFSNYYPVELGLVFFIYWMAINGYHKMKLIYLPNSGRNILLLLYLLRRISRLVFPAKSKLVFPASDQCMRFPEVIMKKILNQLLNHLPELKDEKQHETIEDPGGKSNLSKVPEVSADHEKYFAEIKQAMEPGKLYLDPDLNLAKLSAHTGIPAKQISAVLNQYNQTNFNDFINSYRVSQVGLLMMDPSTRNLTISGLAMDAGFNSQATFQRAFKKHTGMSPRQFIARSLKKSA